MSESKEHRFTIRMDELTWFKMKYWSERDGCKSMNDFFIRAINFYADSLESQENSVLPPAIQSAIDGRIGTFEDRMARLLYKLAVEMDMGISTVLTALEIDPDYMKKLRAESVKNVKATNGKLTFEEKAGVGGD